MFVKNLTKDVLTIRKSGNVLKLQPGMNCVDDTKWSSQSILSVYGSKYVTIINRDVEEFEEVTPAEEIPVEGETEKPAEEIPVEETPVEGETETEKPVEETPVEGETETEKPVETKPKRNAKNSNKNK